MTNNEYQCAMCHGVFTKGWREQEARAETQQYWPGTPQEELAVVCEDCWQQIHPDTHPVEYAESLLPDYQRKQESEQNTTRLQDLWVNQYGMAIPEGAAKQFNQAIIDHFVEKLKKDNPAITEQEIAEQVRLFHKQARGLNKLMADLLIYGEATVDPRDFE